MAAVAVLRRRASYDCDDALVYFFVCLTPRRRHRRFRLTPLRAPTLFATRGVGSSPSGPPTGGGRRLGLSPSGSPPLAVHRRVLNSFYKTALEELLSHIASCGGALLPHPRGPLGWAPTSSRWPHLHCAPIDFASGLVTLGVRAAGRPSFSAAHSRLDGSRVRRREVRGRPAVLGG